MKRDSRIISAIREKFVLKFVYNGEPVFFYSFYSNRDPKAFFAAVLKFVCDVEKIRELPADTPLHHLAATACKKWGYLVVLDGLEVLQHGEDDSHYGWIADGELTEFVARVGAEGGSLLVLTSRFPFPRITDEHPAAARALELPLFTNAEGADLLAVCGLNDPRPRLEGYSELLGGHPLALRIFAGACLEQPFDRPEKVSREVRSAKGVETMPDPDEPGLSPEERQKRRQRRQFYKLLRWFQQKLSPPKRRLLQLVALFRDPVRTDTLAALARGVKAMKEDLASCDAARITGLLDQLSGQFLLQKETSSADDTIHWTAHPIIRDVFREAALAAGDTVAKQFAEIVVGKGEGRRPKTVPEVLPIVEAIEILLTAGDFKAAHELYRSRLENGLAFFDVPALQIGLRCARAFLEPMDRRLATEKEFGQEGLAFYLNETALLGSSVGEMDGVAREYDKAIAILHEANSLKQMPYEEDSFSNVSVCFRNLTEAQTLCGSLRGAIASGTEALFYAGINRDPNLDSIIARFSISGFQAAFPSRNSVYPEPDMKAAQDGHTYRANALSLVGHVLAASHDFANADALKRKNDRDGATLFFLTGIQWARHRLRLGEMEVAHWLTEANGALCKRNGWISDLARCGLLLGELDLLAGNFAPAELHIAEALRILRDAQVGKYLPDALLAMAQVRRAVQLAAKRARRASARPAESASAFTGDESSLSHCEEALRLAARSGFLLKKCDALNFRALLLRESGQPEKALADAKEAHDIAQRCDYYWGIHEALRQLRDTAKALNRTAEFREWDKAERDLTEKMRPEIAEARRINREHDEEMEQLYGKKKKQRQ
ncbi:MAG: hypothetical protein L0Z50_37285 [Verrucomicrobiales bacterium]|nr:hypothetical protein [Verrucomicrobiales bacterium]